jgi:hypothetical protein
MPITLARGVGNIFSYVLQPSKAVSPDLKIVTKKNATFSLEMPFAVLLEP